MFILNAKKFLNFTKYAKKYFSNKSIFNDLEFVVKDNNIKSKTNKNNNKNMNDERMINENEILDAVNKIEVFE